MCNNNYYYILIHYVHSTINSHESKWQIHCTKDKPCQCHPNHRQFHHSLSRSKWVRKANQQCNSSVKCHSTVFRLLWNLHSEPFSVVYLKIYAAEQNNTTSAWKMTIKSMHKSLVQFLLIQMIGRQILNYMAVAESTHNTL